MKVTIKRWHGVATWKWAWTRSVLSGLHHAGRWLSAMWGACNHAFHMHCLMKWLESLQSIAAVHAPALPMCRQDWKFRN
ncbi:Anaphase-promoting complex subunit 11 [Phytophthora cactorum]|nr:Anaphase-promoting complex subunit 11 [Phytophthora cactorum]